MYVAALSQRIALENNKKRRREKILESFLKNV